MRLNNNKFGFTVVEMLVIVPMVILVIGIFIGVIVSMTGEVLATRANNTIAYNIQDALDKMRQDVTLSGGFLSANNITLTSPQGYNNDTTAFKNADSTNGTMLILNSYTTTSNPANSNRELVYVSNQPNQCNSTLLNKNATMMMNVIYFTKTDSDGVVSLWRRTVAPGGYITASCSTPWQQPSCAVGQTGTICKTNDIKLVDHLVSGTGFKINYFSGADSTIPLADAIDSSKIDSARQTSLSTASTVEVTISVSDTIAGREVNQSGSTRISSSNNNTTATTIPAPCPSGFIRVPGSVTYGTNDFCVMKYEAKVDDNGDGVGDTNQNTGYNTWPANTFPISSTRKLVSSAAGYPVVNISQSTAITAASSAGFVYDCASGCHLITESEWMTIAQNVMSVAANWTGGSIGSGSLFTGHSDSAPNISIAASSSDNNGYYATEQSAPSTQRRTLSLTNGEIIWDLPGNVWEWTQGQINGGQPTGMASWNYYQWNAVTGGSFAVNPYPQGTAIPNSSNWNNTNGIGQLYGLTADATLRGFIRGGDWSAGSVPGLLTISLNQTPSNAAGSSVGLRVTR